ncbi:hypothetical protein OG979_00670 [Actinomadura citrea]|uniref:hypothetical protein n=1 Tax=Actinomadura citrea TaxID=46158 RepID=UPI002E27E9A3|nr:hypothetical protein [Actinomadura citrea]
MERLESVAWPLAGGVLCAFVVAVLLKDASWPVGFVFAGVSVAGWSLAATPAAGAALGLAAWAFVTGFDVVGSGDLVVSGPSDAARAAVLLGVGALAGAVGMAVRGSAFSEIEPGWPPPPEECAVSAQDAAPVVGGATDAEPRPGTAPHATSTP